MLCSSCVMQQLQMSIFFLCDCSDHFHVKAIYVSSQGGSEDWMYCLMADISEFVLIGVKDCITYKGISNLNKVIHNVIVRSEDSIGCVYLKLLFFKVASTKCRQGIFTIYNCKNPSTRPASLIIVYLPIKQPTRSLDCETSHKINKIFSKHYF